NRTNDHRLRSGPLLALGSAFLFGASTPIAKLLLGVTDPLLLAGLLYLGSGIGLALVTAAGRSLGLVRPEAPLRARELPWLAAIVFFGGILGPALLMLGLTLTPASSNSSAPATSGDPSSSLQISRSANGARSSQSRRPHHASFFERVVRRTCVLNSTICVFERLICQGIPLVIWWPAN